MAEKIGFDSAIVGLIDDDQETLITGTNGLTTNGIFVIDADSSSGTLSANITGLEPTSKKIYGSNRLVDVIAQGVGNVSLTLAANNIPQDIVDKLCGMKQDSTTGAWYLNQDTSAPYAAVALVSQDSKGNPLYFALYKGKFAPEELKIQTNTNAAQMATDSIKFSAVNRNSDDRVFGRYTVDGTTVTKDKVLADIFKGYTLSSASSTTTSSSSSTH